MSAPNWPDNVAGFDRSRWWRFLVCRSRHPEQTEIVGLLYDRVDDIGGLHWSPKTEYLNDAGTSARLRLHWSNLDAEDRAEARARGLTGLVVRGYGSYSTECPQGCEDRFSHEQFNDLIEKAFALGDSGPAWVDLSLYG